MSELNASDLRTPWWEEKTKSKAQGPAERLFLHYAENDRNRLAAYVAFNSLYTNRDIRGNEFTRAYTAAYSLEGNEYSRVPLNVIKVMADAVHARVTRQAIRTTFVTSDGNQSLRKRAKQMENWVSFAEYATELPETTQQAYLDALVVGTGIVKTVPHPKIDEILNARVHARDVFVDPIEASATGKPSHLYQRQFVSRGRLKKMYPRFSSKIQDAGRITSEVFATSFDSPFENLVEVVEGWKLPSWDGAGDGKHILFISGQVLELEDYELNEFPFSFVRWKDDPTLGFWGISLSEELIGLHFDINTSILHLEKAIEAIPKPYILVPNAGDVSEGELGNVPGCIINYTDRAPQIVMPQSVPGDISNYMLEQWNRAIQVSRLGSLSMPETTGNGFETGQAIRDFADIQSTELAPNYKSYEKFKIRLAEKQVATGKLIADRAKSEGRTFRVVLRKDRNTIEDVDWDNIHIDPRKDSYVVQALPASKLSQTPAGRKSDVIDFLNAGLIDQKEALALLDFPDLDHFRSLANASRDAIERILEEILDEGKYSPPEPPMDTRLALKLTQAYINRAQSMSVEEDRISMLYQFMRQVKALIDEEQEATRMQAAGLTPGFTGGQPALDLNGASPVASIGPV